MYIFTGQKYVELFTRILLHMGLWMISVEMISHPLPAFPQTIHAPTETGDSESRLEQILLKIPWSLTVLSLGWLFQHRHYPSLTWLVRLCRAWQLVTAPKSAQKNMGMTGPSF